MKGPGIAEGTDDTVNAPPAPSRAFVPACALLAFTLSCLPLELFAYGRGLMSLETPAFTVRYSPGLEHAAEAVMRLYPAAANQVSSRSGIAVDFRPTIVVVADREVFERATSSGRTVAYAVPASSLVVIDYPRASADPFGTKGILVHELCHLALHSRIPGIPRWLDEGVAMWASEGVGELLGGAKRRPLSWLAVSGALPRLQSLESSFPGDEDGLALAYEMSRSFVDFLAAGHGKDSIPNLLSALGSGMGLEEGFRVSFGAGVHELEERWRQSLATPSAIAGFLLKDTAAILLSVSAIVTVLAFVRYRSRRKALGEMAEDEADKEVDGHRGL